MTGVWVEPDCAIAHDGNAFTAGGAMVADDRIVVYVGRALNDWRGSILPGEWSRGYGRIPSWFHARYDATDWHGNVLGELTETGCWRVPNGWVSGWMHSYRLELPDGRTYNVRGSGEGMSASGRRARKHGRPV